MSVTVLPTGIQGTKTCKSQHPQNTRSLPQLQTAAVDRFKPQLHAGQVRFKGGDSDESQLTPFEILIQRIGRFFKDLAKAVRKLFSGEKPVPLYKKLGRQIGRAISDAETNDDTFQKAFEATGSRLQKILPDLELAPKHRKQMEHQALLMQSSQGRQRIMADAILDSLGNQGMTSGITKGLESIDKAISEKDVPSLLDQLVPQWKQEIITASDSDYDSGNEADIDEEEPREKPLDS